MCFLHLDIMVINKKEPLESGDRGVLTGGKYISNEAYPFDAITL